MSSAASAPAVPDLPGGTEPHRVGRLRVAVTVGDAARAFELRTRIEALAYHGLPDVIARVADRLDLGEAWLRLGPVALDLGRVAPERLEADVDAALERALADALAAALGEAREQSVTARLVPASVDRLARFTAYLDAGLLPPGEATAPLSLFRRAARDDPAALVTALRRRGGRPHVLERLVLQLGAAGLAELVALLAPHDQALVLALVADVVRVHVLAATPPVPLAPRALAHLLWVTTLEYLLRDGGSQFNRRRFLEYLLRREALRGGVAYGDLIALLQTALGALRHHAGISGSLPLVLGELLAETASALSPDMVEPATSDTDPWMSARRGDFAALAGLVRRTSDGRLPHLADRLDRPLFVGVVGVLSPQGSPAIVGVVDQLVVVNRGQQILATDGLERALRRLTLRFLRHDPGSGFNRRRFLAFLLRHEAARAGVDELALRRALAKAVGRMRSRQGRAASFAATLAELLAEAPAEAAAPAPDNEIARGEALALRIIADPANDAVAAWLGELAADPSGGMAARLPPDRFAHLIGSLAGPVATAIVREGAVMRRAHRRGGLGALLAAQIDALWRHAVLTLLIEGVPAERRRERLAAVLAPPLGIAPARLHALLDDRVGPEVSGRSASAVALRLRDALAARSPRTEVAALVRRLAAASTRRLAAVAAGLTTAERWTLLHAVHPAHAGRALAVVDALVRHHRGRRLAALDETRFAALGWALASAYLVRSIDLPWRPDAMARHLLDGLADVGRAVPLRQAVDDALTAIDGGHVVDAAVPGIARAVPAPPADTGATGGATTGGSAIDGIAMLARWLDTGALPSWAPTGLTARALLGTLDALPVLDLRMLFARPGRASTLERLVRAAATLDAAATDRLLARLVPALARGTPLAEAIRRLPPARRRAAALRAAEAVLARRPSAIEALGEALPTARSARPPGPMRSITGRADERDAAVVERALAWFAGGREPARDHRGLARLLARLADIRDARLLAALAHGRGDPRAAARWAAILPPEGVARLVHLLHPAGAARLLQAARLLLGLARAGAPFAAALLRSAIAQHGLAQGVAALVAALPGGAAEHAALRAQARRLAAEAGADALAAALAPRTAVVPLPAEHPPVVVADPPRVAFPEPEPEFDGAPLFVDNAGLVLVASYLPMLFERLALLTPDADGVPRLADLEARSRAVHLLQYLVDGTLATPEPRLALNKLLCGIAFAAPVAAEWPATAAERETCDGLLGAVIGHWPILGDASIAALRETFLQREGRLLHTESGWSLVVQRRGLIDHLVDHLPWGFGTVFHRWMPEPLRVTW